MTPVIQTASQMFTELFEACSGRCGDDVFPLTWRDAPSTAGSLLVKLTTSCC